MSVSIKLAGMAKRMSRFKFGFGVVIRVEAMLLRDAVITEPAPAALASHGWTGGEAPPARAHVLAPLSALRQMPAS